MSIFPEETHLSPSFYGLLTPDELSAIFEVGEETLKKWRGIGYGPPWIKIGQRVWYRQSDVMAWVSNQSHGDQGNGGNLRFPYEEENSGC